MKEASIVDLLILSLGAPQWNVIFFRDVQDWEVDAFLEFYDLVYSIHITRGVEDTICWCPCKKGKFTVRSYCQAMIILIKEKTIKP